MGIETVELVHTNEWVLTNTIIDKSNKKSKEDEQNHDGGRDIYLFENKVFDNKRFKKSYVVNGIRIDAKSLEYTSTE